MDEIHKKILQRNRSNLVKDLDPSKLYDGLLEKGIFTQDMIDEIQSAGTRRNQARQLVQDLETRGSRAFPLFLQCLQETGQESLAELLQNGAPATPTQVVRPEIQPLPITPPVDGNKPGKDVKKPQIPSSSPPGGEKPRPGPGRVRRDSLQGYKMDASPCGHCLIINNMEFEPHSMLKNRKGSNIDCEKLERRFKTLNFVVEVRTNLRQKQIKHELLTLSKKDHSQYDCCVVIMLSHGTEVNHNRFPGAVYGVDGQYVPVQHITNYLNGQHCPSLQGKPKLFFIQACGGDEKDMGFEVSPDEVEPSSGGVDDQTDAIPMSSSSDSLSMSDEPDARPTLPTPSDILVSYSTFPGYVSWRETQSGSWYVQTLDCILEESAATVDLVTMLMMVNNEVSQNSAKGLYKQMPGSFNFLRKLLYFQTQT
ncbi:caspase-9 isoform X1 [Pundamilia nyererei]|uniref:Caspase-9 isoform X1 n=1 Tax=Pundamilia nyererei TaxID=303518 RepID=A0A9Y3R7M0_9CICH|nr:PREDICTED: caspase-9 isoform X1 [Pundamilia nyererei]XP_005730781.1 PREDICTED: caspase-9 isoform X1 [Pundamilia nyererei]